MSPKLDSTGLENPAFEADEDFPGKDDFDNAENGMQQSPERKTWGNSLEFLMSCIAMSVGFGNIWRFPFTAYENGGGAFLIPYIILLFLVGKPFYFLEMIIGQFSGNSSIRVWSVVPAFRGVGWAQVCSTIALVTYYTSLMALTLFFLISSFSSELPWAKCQPEWEDRCIDSSIKRNVSGDQDSVHSLLQQKYKSSAELYFSKVVLKEKSNIDDGIGWPDWKLTLCLLGSWLAVFLVISRGVKSAGKASYFLALFPYAVILCLLIRAVTLEGAGTGILFFITPDWSKLLKPEVWDVLIVTTLDTFTSMIAGCTIFGILGNLAYEMEIDDVGAVVNGGAGLAFISYPDAIAKFSFLPQLFAVLFFVMMFVLGVGSAVGMMTSIITVIKEEFPSAKHWQIVIPSCIAGFCIANVYVTPGGQYILTLVDYYGTSFVIFVLAFFEITGIVWIYGIENFLDDVEFMLNRKPSAYWRLCWFLITPILLIAIFLYTVVNLEPLTYAGHSFPWTAHTAGWILLLLSLLQIPIWVLITIFNNKSLPTKQKIESAFRPLPSWGPRDPENRKEWLIFKEQKMKRRKTATRSTFLQKLCIILNI
ncbi:sodium-dependent nutrient amino acid transporter 1-like isoform X2 [Prorops nasuta]|uniref:sodium-dependent nutrient amino acid transporter 1-like isoform X2 n=1 Tax=Prorops nasuta TaxID=863751 RepID=UPI0034CF5090